MVKENRVQEYAFAEKHILESKAKSLALEKRDSEKRNIACDNPDALGIPPGNKKYWNSINFILYEFLAKSYFNVCVDNTFMKKYGLVGPEDYIKPNDTLFPSFLFKNGIV